MTLRIGWRAGNRTGQVQTDGMPSLLLGPMLRYVARGSANVDPAFHGIGIRTGNMLFVASGTGPDVNIARFTLGNGTMNSDWFKLGSLEQGQSAAMSP